MTEQCLQLSNTPSWHAMKVLALTPQYLPVVGGIEILIDMLAQALRLRSIETIVATAREGRVRYPDRDIVNNTAVYRFDFTRALQSGRTAEPLKVLRQLIELVEAEQPNVIHMHSAQYSAPWYVDRLFKRFSSKIPLIVTEHGVLEPGDRLAIVRDLLVKAHAITGVSQAVLLSALEFSRRTGYSKVIYNGVRQFEDIGWVDRPGPRYRLSCVGRLHYEKGFDLAIAALAKVRSKGLDAVLTVIGEGEDRDFLQSMALHHGVADHVIFTGALNHRNARAAIAASSLILIPSRMHEGFSLVAAEAAASGIPCVASRVGGLAETVEHGVSGLLVVPNDVDDLTSATIELLGDVHRARAIGAQARRLARQKFDMDRCVADYVELYREVTHRG